MNEADLYALRGDRDCPERLHRRDGLWFLDWLNCEPETGYDESALLLLVALCPDASRAYFPFTEREWKNHYYTGDSGELLKTKENLRNAFSPNCSVVRKPDVRGRAWNQAGDVSHRLVLGFTDGGDRAALRRPGRDGAAHR